MKAFISGGARRCMGMPPYGDGFGANANYTRGGS